MSKNISNAKLLMFTMGLVSYSLVGWIIVSIIKSIIGDPVKLYIESTHDNAIIIISNFFYIAFNFAVGFSAIRFLGHVVYSDDASHLAARLKLLRQHDPNWDSDLIYCEDVMRVGSKSFFLASLLLPGWMRGPAIALYSFCRKADDDVDEGNVEGAKLRLQLLEKRLADAYDGNPHDNQVDRAFSAVVRAFEIPKSLLDAMLEGFRWDLDKVEYESYSDVIAYSARVAASVGGMMTILMGGSCRVTFARAFDLGAAMQLTNIARDVGEDARNGRVYLPAEWLREEGIDPKELLREPRHSPGLARVIERLLAKADMLYDRADHGISMLPMSCRVAIRAARLIYSEIGTKLKKNSYDSISRRTVVSKKKKILLALRVRLCNQKEEDLSFPQACSELFRPPRAICNDHVLPECEFLLKDILPLLKDTNLTAGDVTC